MHHARIQHRSRLVPLGLAALALLMLLAPKPTRAMTVMPPLLDLTLDPGTVVADVVQVHNEESVPFKIRAVTQNFYVAEGDERSGAPDFYGPEEVRTGYEMADWIEVSGEGTVIEPGAWANVPITIRVPEDAQPGSHFGAIQILASKPDDIASPDGSSVSIERGTSILIFVRVNGDVIDELVVSEFKAEPAHTRLPVDFTIRLTNSGTTHQRPVGNVIIEDMLGRQVASIQVNPGPQYRSVLPGSARRYDVSWLKRRLPDGASEYEQQLKNFALGKYTATMFLNYGSSEEQRILSAVTEFWVVPWMALLTYAGIVLAALLVAVAGVRAYNRMLIRRYEAGKKKGKNLNP